MIYVHVSTSHTKTRLIGYISKTMIRQRTGS